MLIWLDDPKIVDWHLVGGKAVGLGKLVQAGLPVPPGFVVSVESYLQAMNASGLASKIGGIRGSDNRVTETLAMEAASLRKRIENLSLSPELIQMISNAYLHLAPDHNPVAVRSSATMEDMEGASFAGQQETFLGVQGEDQLLQRIKDCWASCFTDHAVSYRERHGYSHQNVAMAVVVQRMVNAQKSGVLFTAHPVKGTTDQVVVEACWGLGEALVSGQVAPDHYVMSRQTGNVLERHVLPKRHMIIHLPGQVKTSIQPVPQEKMYAPILSDEELKRLTDLAVKVEAFFGSPQDVEWAIVDSNIYLLQSRPITTMKQANFE